MAMPSYLPLVGGWRYAFSPIGLALQSGTPMPFAEQVSLLKEPFPGWFQFAVLSTTDPKMEFIGKMDGITVASMSVRRMVWTNQNNEYGIRVETYARYLIEGFDLPIYTVRFASPTGQPFKSNIEIVARSRTPNSLIMGFDNLVIVVEDQHQFMEDARRKGFIGKGEQ